MYIYRRDKNNNDHNNEIPIKMNIFKINTKLSTLFWYLLNINKEIKL